nr:PfkB family carbohydrate kinase [Tessaracoccus sp. OS52]
MRTVTLNTGYDDYYTVTGFDWGGLGRMHAYQSVCSGKGVSCARTAVALGLPTKAYALVGAEDLDHYSGRLSAEGLPHDLVSVPGRTRHNLTLVDGTGEQVAAHFVAAGFDLTGPDAVAPLVERVVVDVVPGDVVTLNGSTPSGLPDSTWADLARSCLEAGARVVVDAQKAAFREALKVPGLTAFKPNDDEIAALPGIAEAPAELRVKLALEQLAATGVRIPLVSLGARGVALLRDGELATMSCPVDSPIQSVMAGDAFVAGLVWGLLQDRDEEDCIRHGLAAAAAHVSGLTGEALRLRAVENLDRVV